VNPFVYGEVVPATAFVNRVAELDRLVGDLAAGQKVFLISPRRYGKSSLIRQALAAMGAGGADRGVTIAASAHVAFLEGYARAGGRGTKWDRARTWLREAINRRARRSATPRPVATRALSVSFPNVRSERDIRGSRRRSSRCPRGSPRRGGAGRRRARRFRRSRLQWRIGRGTRCAAVSISATSGKSSPDRSRA
jgi:hypothetical protein